MTDLSYNLKLRKLIAAWSDNSEIEANRFADRYRDLYPREISNAQLRGLENVIRSSRQFIDVKGFIQHQGEKAERARRSDVGDFWRGLDSDLSSLRDEAKRMLHQTGSEISEVKLDRVHHQLAEIYVQHLIAHMFYWTPFLEEKGKIKRHHR